MSAIDDRIAQPSSMNSQHLDVYSRIQTFSIDEPNVSLPFSQRLARDNHWSATYTQQVIEEYKKFLFLTLVADHPVTPSDAVDQAWHLHLTYTHSYWDELCGRILRLPLHHHPTRGGARQRELFWDCYSKTLDSYEQFFGYLPPAHIWQTPTIRFSRTGQFRRVNTQDYWFIPKPSLKIFQLLTSRIPSWSWLRVVLIALLGFALVLSPNFLCHSPLSACSDVITSFANQPTLAQVSPQPNGYTQSQPNVGSPQFPGWAIWMLLILLIGTTVQMVDSWCSHCKRFKRITTTQVLEHPTTETEGFQLVTKRCIHCKHEKRRYKSIPKKSNRNDSDFGCACV